MEEGIEEKEKIEEARLDADAETAQRGGGEDNDPSPECPMPGKQRGFNVAARLFISLTITFLVFAGVIYLSIQFIMPAYLQQGRQKDMLTTQNFVEKLEEEIRIQKAINPDASVEEITEAFKLKYEKELNAPDNTFSFMRVLLILTLVFFVFAVYFYAKSFARPLQKLNRAAKEIAALNFDYEIDINRRDEIGQLAESIQEMSEKLKSSLTELKIRNEQLQTELEHERELDKMRKKFVSDVSHELKTPLSIIGGYAEALQIGIDDRGRRKDYTVVIMEEVGKMSRLVGDLLSLSKYESAEYKLNLGVFDMGELLERVIYKYGDILKKNEIRLILTAGSGFVGADPDRIEQCINNFLNNAISHADEKKIIFVRGEREGAKYRLAVINSGEHIPDGDIENIWGAFYRADKARSRDEGRFGVGLSIVRALLTRHGAVYGVRNVTNLVMKEAVIESGVEFYFELDTAEAPPAE